MSTAIFFIDSGLAGMMDAGYDIFSPEGGGGDGGEGYCKMKQDGEFCNEG